MHYRKRGRQNVAEFIPKLNSNKGGEEKTTCNLRRKFKKSDS